MPSFTMRQNLKHPSTPRIAIPGGSHLSSAFLMWLKIYEERNLRKTLTICTRKMGFKSQSSQTAMPRVKKSNLISIIKEVKED